MRPLRRGGTALVLGAVIALLAACTGGSPPADDGTGSGARPLTTEEAQVLATMRFRNFDAGSRSVAFTIADAQTTSFQGWFDYGSGVGYGSVRVEGADALLIWDESLVGTHAPPPDGLTPLPPPDTAADTTVASWTGAPLAPSDSRRDAVLAVIGSLGSDRPENPLLLQQTGALRLDEETVDGVHLTVFAGPTSDAALPQGATPDPQSAATKYWVDASGLAHRVEIRLGGEAGWTRIDLGDAGGIRLEDPFVPGAS